VREGLIKARGLPDRNQDWVGKLGRFYDEEVLAELERLASRIEKAAKSDEEQFRKRVAVFLTGHQYTCLQARTMALNDKKNKTVEEFNRLIALATEKERWLENLGPTWAISAPVLRWHTLKNKFGPSVGYLYYESLQGKTISAPLPTRWKFYLDQPDAGETKGLHTDRFDDSALVSLSIYDLWENQGFDYNGMAWYRVRFTAPPRKPGRRYYLWFGAIDDGYWIYLNGQKVGETFTDEDHLDVWYTPYTCDVTDQLNYGEENLIAVKVRDIAGGGGIYKGAFLLEAKE